MWEVVGVVSLVGVLAMALVVLLVRRAGRKARIQVASTLSWRPILVRLTKGSTAGETCLGPRLR